MTDLKMKTVQMKMPEALLAETDEAAGESGMQRSEYIRESIRKTLTPRRRRNANRTYRNASAVDGTMRGKGGFEGMCDHLGVDPQTLSNLEKAIIVKLDYLDACAERDRDRDRQPRTMKNSEWNKCGFPMSWSIYADNSANDYNEWILNLAAPRWLEDGVYDVARRNDSPAFEGVTIKQGAFIPAPTAEACYKASCAGTYGMSIDEISKRPAIDHRYIEDLEYDDEKAMFFLSVGS